MSTKAEEIWAIMTQENPHFVLHICSNYTNGFEPNEEKRLEVSINTYRLFKIEYNLLKDLVHRLESKERKTINARFTVAKKEMFELASGGIKAVIVNCSAFDILRIISDDPEIRNTPDFSDHERLKCTLIQEDSFYDNVRVYLKQQSKINKGIKQTALSSEEDARFFYYNNGITITCETMDYPNIAHPIITLENLQIVNGSQTVHALNEAYLESESNLDNVSLLCRIYESKKPEITAQIAEFTNSQNPIKSRDIRANDDVQRSLELGLKEHGYYYERKRNQFEDEIPSNRIDSEKLGQAILAFYKNKPREARDQKRKVFGEYYDQIFNNELTAERALLAYELYRHVEHKKQLYSQQGDIESKIDFLPYASYAILYLLSQLAEAYNTPIRFDNIEDILDACYEESIDIIATIVKKEKEKKGDDYSNPAFIKTTRFQRYLDNELENRIKENSYVRLERNHPA